MMDIMPWTDEHKERTRERIVQAAAAALRARGVDGVSIAEIMAEAGLTHGGFYAHFGSKDDLLRAALDAANGQTLDMLSAATQSTSPDQRIGAVVDAYLSPKHAAHPERGCPLAALGPELARAPGKVRDALSLGVERRLEWLESVLPGNGHDDEEATALLACMVGGLILARAVLRSDRMPCWTRPAHSCAADSVAAVASAGQHVSTARGRGLRRGGRVAACERGPARRPLGRRYARR